MRLGVIARGENRGLGILTWEVCRHLNPDKVLLVNMGSLARGFPIHHARYDPSRTTVAHYYDGHLDERVVRDWLDGLDVVYSAETFYDRRLVGWGKLAGVKTILHAMPEFLPPDMPRPTRLWLPTPWRAEHAGPHLLVPIPVPLDRWRWPAVNVDGPLRVLHVAGHQAAADRNGTVPFLRACSILHEAVDVTVVDQDARSWSNAKVGPYSTLKIEGPHADYWTMYEGHDVLVMPRRYGGLCLPVQEAIGAGLVPLLPAISPNEWYPAVLTKTSLNGRLFTQAGPIRIGTPLPSSIASAIDLLARDRGALAAQRRRTAGWADEHSWDALLPYWRRALEETA
jgi:hypothetical protein